MNSMGDWSLETRLIALDGAEDDWFGYDVDIDGNYAIAGAISASDSGAAYVFMRNGTTWTQQAKLTAEDGEIGDSFGYSVSINGEYALVGAPLKNVSGFESGVAYIFKRNATIWYQQAKLVSSDIIKAFDMFGSSVCIDGDYALIGASFDGLGKGAAYVFKRSGTTWYQQAKLTPKIRFPGLLISLALGDSFGCSVALDGDYALIGAEGDDSFNGLDAGAAYVFKRIGNRWYQQDRLMASEGLFFQHMDDYFGCSVDIDGDYALIGANAEHVDGEPIGTAYVFKRQGMRWIEQERITASDAEFVDGFGHSVSLDDNYALIGCPSYRNNSVSGVGYLFERNEDIWYEQDMFAAGYGQHFAWSVSLDNGSVLIGAWGDDVGDVQAGSAYLFSN